MFPASEINMKIQTQGHIMIQYNTSNPINIGTTDFCIYNCRLFRDVIYEINKKLFSLKH